jgi:hypothetical protein
LQALFVLQLMEIVWDLASPPATISRIAGRLGVSTRAVRQASQELQREGLLVIYDQFDDTGAQVENGYDLSELFARLTALAPSAGPGQQHVRRARPTGQPVNAQPDVSLPGPSPLKQASPSPLKQASPSPLKQASVPGGTRLQGQTEADRRGGLNQASELNKNPEEQQKNLSAAAVSARETMEMPDPASAGDTCCDVLARCGLNPNVVAAVGPGLPLAEAWAVWSYARGARLGPAWIATQLYDYATMQPRPAPSLPGYTDAAAQLAQLSIIDAAHLLDVVDTACPDMPEALDADEWLSNALAGNTGAALRRAVDMLWTAMAAQRAIPVASGSRPQSRPPKRSAQGVSAGLQATLLGPEPAILPHAALWAAARDRLARDLPATDWNTWIAPLVVLDLVDDMAVIGAPNVFVRDEVMARYREPLATVLGEQIGRAMQIELVVGSAVS